MKNMNLQSASFASRAMPSVWLAAVLLTFAPQTANAQLAASFVYDHNGSSMLVERDRRRVTITYDKPRSALRKHGVKPGTMLFQGRLDQGGILEGDAHIFSATCGTTPYYVHGKYKEGRSFTLAGAAPVFEQCRIVDNRYDIANAKLLFTVKHAASPEPENTSLPTNTGTNFARYCLTNVQSGLNLRVGPGTDYGIIDEIPANACDVQAHNQRRQDWLAVEWQGSLGWVSGRYLRRAR